MHRLEPGKFYVMQICVVFLTNKFNPLKTEEDTETGAILKH